MDKMFNFINFLKKYHLINNPNMDHYEVIIGKFHQKEV